MLLNHRACVQGSISGDGRGGATTLMITNYQPPKEPREHKEPDGVTSSSTSVSSAMDELSSKDKVRALNRLAQKGSTRQNMNLFSPDSGSEASDHSEPHNFTVWHKRAPPEPPTHADQLAVQGKRIDEEVERAQKLLDVRKQLYAMTQSDASKPAARAPAGSVLPSSETRRRSSISAQSMKATRLHTRTKHLKLKFSRLNIHQSLP